jgi:hypothetical protein
VIDPAGLRRRGDLARIYRREYPVALFFSIGIFLIGAITLIAPEVAQESPIAIALPEWARKVFYAAWVIAGGTSTVGIWRARLDLEAAGMTLTSSALFAYFTALAGVGVLPVGSALFILSLAAGCGWRAYELTRKSREVVRSSTQERSHS